MIKNNKRIEIVASTEANLSSMGRSSRTAIQAVLLKYYHRVDITIVNNLSDLAALGRRKPDLVFLGMKFIPSDPMLGLSDPNKIWLSEYLDDRGIAYTGSSYDATMLELNKDLAKQQLLDVGLPTARFMVIQSGDKPVAEEITLNYPLFVKPTNGGGGSGVDAGSLVHTFQQLKSKVQSLALDLQSDSLVEEYLPGREFSVGILKQLASDEYAVMPIELVAPPDESGARFLSGQVKVSDSETNLAVTDEVLKAQINELAIKAFHALGARDYGRIDIRLDAAGRPHFLEANLLPSLLDNYGNFPKTCLLNIQLAHAAMILSIVDLAFAHRVSPDEAFSEAIMLTPLVLPGAIFEPV